MPPQGILTKTLRGYLFGGAAPVKTDHDLKCVGEESAHFFAGMLRPLLRKVEHCDFVGVKTQRDLLHTMDFAGLWMMKEADALSAERRRLAAISVFLDMRAFAELAFCWHSSNLPLPHPPGPQSV